MKLVAFIVVFFVCAAVCFAASKGTPPKPEVYTTKYDHINLDEILNNPKLVKSYVNCLVTGNACTPQGRELRTHLPDALKTECAKCTTAQRNGAIKVIDKLQKDYKEEWKKLSTTWDPTGEYFKKLTANIKATPAKAH